MSFLARNASYMLYTSTTKYQAAMWHHGMRNGDLNKIKSTKVQYGDLGEGPGRKVSHKSGQ